MQRLKALLRFRPSFLKPRVAVIEGLTDPVTGLMMGNTAENVARLFAISRQEQDKYALQSHERAAAARKAGRLAAEIAPLVPPPRYQAMAAEDNGVRPGQTLEDLAKLKPVFDRRDGDVTVGNSCQITDGAVALLCTSEARAKAMGLQPLCVVRGHARVALDPAVMGLGPVHAAPKALRQAGVNLKDLDLIEINEAFAAQVLACLKAFASDKYCKEQLGLPGAIGEVDPQKLNVNGGAIALGHPIAATGARLVLTLGQELRRRGTRFGMAALCVGGGQGQAMVLEAS
jgi:acetyl-CoA acetyltransferase family protein